MTKLIETLLRGNTKSSVILGLLLGKIRPPEINTCEIFEQVYLWQSGNDANQWCFQHVYDDKGNDFFIYLDKINYI